MAAFSIDTIFRAIDKFSGPLQKMERANQSFAERQDKMLRGMNRAFGNVRNQLLGLAGGVSIASVIFTGANAVVKYDEAIQSLSAITGVSGKELDKFKVKIIDVSTRTKKSAVDVAKAFELVGSAQPELLKDATGLSRVSEAAIILSKASRDDLSVSAANVTGVLNQFGLGAEYAERAINVLSAGAVVGASNISDVTESMKNVGAVASTANASVEQTVALIEVLGKFQLKGAEAGTKLRGMFIKLQQAGLGYKSGQFNINDALEEANKKLSRYTNAKQKDAAMLQMFGLENITAGKIILNNTKLFEEYTQGVTGTNSAYEMAAKNSASFSVKLQELKARFENLIISGNENSKTLNKLGKVIGFLTNHLDTILTLVGIALVVFGSYYILMTSLRLAMIGYNFALDLYILLSGKSILLMQSQGIALKAYTAYQWLANTAAWSFTAALLANPITWVVAGVIALIAGIVLLVKHWDKVKKKMDEWSNSAIFQIISILNPIVKVIEFIGFMQDRWQGIKTAFKDGGFLEGIKAIGRAIFSFLLKPIEVVLRAIGKLTGAKWATSAADSIQNFRDILSPEDKKEESKQQKVTPIMAQYSKNEEINKNQLEVSVLNKSDNRIEAKYNSAPMPLLSTVW